MLQPKNLQDAHHDPSSPSSSFVGLGKRVRRGSPVTPGISSTVSSLSTPARKSVSEGALSVFCRRLRRSFLVDSGADVSVFPATSAQKKSPSSMVLQAANGSAIET